MEYTKLDDKFKNRSISVGTLNNAHLLETFMEFILETYPEKADELIKEYNIPEDKTFEKFAEENHLLTAELVNEDIYYFLNDVAPEGCYFGSLEGDGADIGFWEILEEEDM